MHFTVNEEIRGFKSHQAHMSREVVDVDDKTRLNEELSDLLDKRKKALTKVEAATSTYNNKLLAEQKSKQHYNANKKDDALKKIVKQAKSETRTARNKMNGAVRKANNLQNKIDKVRAKIAKLK